MYVSFYTTKWRVTLLIWYMNRQSFKIQVHESQVFKCHFGCQTVSLSSKGCALSPKFFIDDDQCTYKCNAQMHIDVFMLEACGRTQHWKQPNPRAYRRANYGASFGLDLLPIEVERVAWIRRIRYLDPISTMGFWPASMSTRAVGSTKEQGRPWRCKRVCAASSNPFTVGTDTEALGQARMCPTRIEWSCAHLK